MPKKTISLNTTYRILTNKNESFKQQKFRKYNLGIYA